MTKRNFFIFWLIFLVGFLILPESVLAIEDIDLRTLGKHLVLPESMVQKLIHSLIGIFYSQGQIVFTDPTTVRTEEEGVLEIMKEVVRLQALTHLLVDAPFQMVWGIVNNAVKITRLIGTKDISVILGELERESVKKATEYGMKFLLQNEIRMAPGAISFKYISRKGNQKEAIFQYVMIYQPIDTKRGKVLIRFYSPNSLEPPESRGNPWGSRGMYIEHTANIQPFIVDIRGNVDNFKWVGNPSIDIDFPPEVPDLGIKPLSFWERRLLKPIQTTIKEAEIIITKVTGGSTKIAENFSKISEVATNVWDTIKSTISTISKFDPFGAWLVHPSPLTPQSPLAPPPLPTLPIPPLLSPPSPATQPLFSALPPSQSGIGQTLRQTEVNSQQEEIDDLLEKIDILKAEIEKTKRKIAQFEAKSRKEKTKEEIKEKEAEEEEKDVEEEAEETEDSEKKKGAEDICFVNSVNINTASKGELQKITGIGPVIAQRIIETRPFYSLNDLLKVKGIGPITLQKIIAQGCAYVKGFYLAAGGGAGGAAAAASSSSPPSYPRILISEVQIEGNNRNHDFIELYNPNPNLVDISSWKLRKRASTGSESSIRLFPSESTIPAKGYYLWASSEDENYPSLINADASTKQTLVLNNSIALLTPDNTIISALAWGSSTNPFVEISPFPDSPGKNKSLGRIWDEEKGEYKNIGNNSADFEIQTPTPKAQNQSPIPQPPTPHLAVVINEIAWMGTAASSSDEWIELHNTTKNPVDLTGWTLASITDNSPNITLLGAIPPLGFYLLERTASVTTSVGEDQIYTGALNNNSNCEILTLYDQTNKEIDKTVCLGENWPAGDNLTKTTMERINPRTSGENVNNWANNNQITRNGLDDGTPPNPINGTPWVQNSVYQSLSPAVITNLTIDFQNSYGNKVKLFWSAPEDLDTLSANLSYKIYYSKEDSLTENNLTVASTFSALDSQTTITISNLSYNSTYYFGIKAFDPQNNSSPLSDIISYQTATLTTVASGFSPNLTIDNNGRKIVRDSNGNLYVVYSKKDSKEEAKISKIFLATSTDNGKNWVEFPITPDATTAQKNPSIAIDSKNNLHIVWQEKVGANIAYQIRYGKYSGDSWSDLNIENLTNNQERNQEVPVIVVDPQNNLHLAWIDGRNIYYSNTVGGNWGEVRIVKNYEFAWGYYSSISHLDFAIDNENILHFVWFESLPSMSGTSPHLRYRKGISGEIKNLATVDLQNYSSIIIDSKNNLHIVWHEPDNRGAQGWYSLINYIKYTNNWGQIKTLSEEKNDSVIASPSITIDSRDYLYIVWKRHNLKPLSQIEYRDGLWQEVKELISPFAWQGFPNLLYQTNQPKTGFALIFYEGTNLKFYASQDLTWE